MPLIFVLLAKLGPIDRRIDAYQVRLTACDSSPAHPKVSNLVWCFSNAEKGHKKHLLEKIARQVSCIHDL